MKDLPEKIKNSFCVLPWMHSATTTDGKFKVCCWYRNKNSDIDDTFLTDDNGNIMNGETISLDETRNAKQLKEVRKVMLSGVLPDLCFKCKNLEKYINGSKRTNQNNMYMKYLKDVFEYTNDDGSIDPVDFPVLKYDLRMGNICNCKCVICSSKFSNMHGPTIDWIKNLDNQYMQDIINSPDILEIYLTGGETTVMKLHWDFIDRLIELDRAKNIYIKYAINGVIMKEDFVYKWAKFRKSMICFSIDGMGDVYEKIRTPAKWNIVKKNLELFEKLSRDLPQMVGVITPTVCTFNVYAIPELMKWILDKNWTVTQFTPFLLYSQKKYSIVGRRDLYDKAYPLYEPLLDTEYKEQCMIILNSMIK